MQFLYTHALLGEVLSKLTSYGDLIICSAVCRTWRSTCDQLQPKCLEIPGGKYVMTNTVPVLEWLQRMQKRDRLDRLDSLRLELRYGTRPPGGVDEVARFGQSVIVMAGFWHLRHCWLEGDFDITLAGRILPVTLQELALIADSDRMPSVLHLSTFERFTMLQSLEIDMCGEDDWMYGFADSSKHFALDAVLPSLIQLYLGVWPLRLALGFNLVDCLPALQHVVACAYAQEARSFLQLPHLKYCGLVSVAGFGWQACQLTVNNYSQLMKVVIHGTLGDNVQVEVHKSGVQLLCRDASAHEYISYVGDCEYKAANKFPELPRC